MGYLDQYCFGKTLQKNPSEFIYAEASPETKEN
jgi:hypothetical protein